MGSDHTYVLEAVEKEVSVFDLDKDENAYVFSHVETRTVVRARKYYPCEPIDITGEEIIDG